ncbi:hypothetical protein [Alistipes timonensis]|uniref:hypothetical protein n=1 Tax=Alistipes timonensis TaxID=1465754 RepID=UPI001E3A91D2|nr:hypothetical protein [Alistipes timonensis]
MRDMPDCGIGSETPVEDCAVDMWADRAEYVDDLSFNLYVTQAEDNILWNAEKKGCKPGRLNVPQQRITVRGDTMGAAPFIPVVYLTILGAKLLAMAFPDERTDAGLSDYDDENVMLGMMDQLQAMLDDMTGEISDGENDDARPVS